MDVRNTIYLESREETVEMIAIEFRKIGDRSKDGKLYKYDYSNLLAALVSTIISLLNAQTRDLVANLGILHYALYYIIRPAVLPE